MGLSTNGNPFFTTKYGAWGLSKNSGKVNWTLDSDDFVAHPNGKMILSNEWGKVMVLWNSDTGQQVWNYEMKFSNTQNVQFTSDSCMVVMEKGIHHVYLPTGATWSRKIKGFESYNPLNQGGRSGIVGGALFMFGLAGVLFAIATISTSSVGSKTSNYLLEEDAIYIAAKYLARYNHSDSLIWISGDLLKNRGVNSIISLDENDFLLVDYGYKYNTDGVKVRSGDASCEFYSKQTGEMLRSIILHTEGDDFIKDFVLHNQTISFLGKRSLFTISLETLETLKIKEFGGAYSNIGLTKFVDPNDFRLMNDKFVRMSKIADGKLLIRNTGNKVAEFDENLDLVKVYSSKEFYELSDENKGFALIKNSEESLLIDRGGKKAIEFILSVDAGFYDGFLLDTKNHKATLFKLN
jgi:hypothetical protein